MSVKRFTDEEIAQGQLFELLKQVIPLDAPVVVAYVRPNSKLMVMSNLQPVDRVLLLERAAARIRDRCQGDSSN